MKKILFSLFIIGLLVSCSPSKKLPAVSGDGSSYDKAIYIESVHAEYVWLKEHYQGCKVESQSLNFYKKMSFDILDITLSDGTRKSVYFNISNFFGK